MGASMGACCSKGGAGIHAPAPTLLTSAPVAGGDAAVAAKPSTMGQTRSRVDSTMSASASLKGPPKGQLIFKNAGNIRDTYEMEARNIGKGAFGSVCKGKHISTGVVRAIKTVQKGNLKNTQALKQEIETMKAMDHPHIISLFETFEDRRNIYFAMELCSGGELFDCITSKGSFSEGGAAIVLKQILSAVFYMHSEKIIHRDLKPENFLFLNKEKPAKNLLKLIDFGLACPIKPGQLLKTKLGTPFYMAPQVLMGRYDTQADVWSVGVIAYILLCGRPPFHGPSDSAVLAKVRSGVWRFEGESWRHISDDGKAFVKNMLKMSPQSRYTAEQALNDEWIKLQAPRAANASFDAGVLARLRGFRAKNRLRQAAMGIVVGQLEESQICGLREAFQALDQNGDGKLTLLELTEGLKHSGLDLGALDVEGLVKSLDDDQSGAIDYTEFLAATIDRKKALTEDVLWTAFNVFDVNNDGKISQAELKRVLCNETVGKVVQADVAKQLMNEVDANGDGNIEFDEFVSMMRAISIDSLACDDETEDGERSSRRKATRSSTAGSSSSLASSEKCKLAVVDEKKAQPIEAAKAA